MKKAFTLIEVLISTALFLIVFVGIFGAFWLSFRVIGLLERKISATQIAQGEIEKIRNLPYLDIGTIGASLPFASGTLEASTTTILNKTEYKIERKIKYISDLTDDPEECPLDYKRVEITVSFSGIFGGKVNLSTDISPKDKVEEAKACHTQPAGILSIQVFDATGKPVPFPLIEIFDPKTQSKIDFALPSSGKYDFPLSPGTYKVVVSKEGYSLERTFGIDEVAIPQKPNPIVLEGQITQISFSIDKVSSILVKTLFPFGQGNFSDSFLDQSKVSKIENVEIENGQAQLVEGTTFGYLISIEISPQNLIEWQEFSFTGEEPQGTDLKYQILFASGTEWVLIPDSDLPGNSIGFDFSPVSLSHLSTTTYSKIKLKAIFSRENVFQSPILKDWQVSWKSSSPTPISNVTFNLKGEKLIGRDAQENPIYKFNKTFVTDNLGKIEVQNLEWDLYFFSNFQKDSQSLNLASSIPEHPVSLVPNANLEVSLYLEAQNSLLVTVFDGSTLDPIFSAAVTIFDQNFSQTQFTDSRGQTIFIPLQAKTYNLFVEAPGYYSTTTQIFVSGNVTKVLKLQPSE